MRTMVWARRLSLASAILVLGAGCAEQRAPINRVQANALAKSFFVGENLASTEDDPEFFMRPTVVDVGFGSDASGLFTSTYAQPVSRIKWEIAEDLLIARLTHELIEDADGHGSVRTNNGVVAAAFAITSHFDIRRSYNTATGEETNVIEENTSDRPWFEREYFRVDWSKNLVTDTYDFDLLSMLGILGGVEFSPLSYDTSEPGTEDAPVFDPEMGYFDVTTRVYAIPKILETPYGTYPACYFNGEVSGGTYPIGNCNPTEVKVRHAFRRIVPEDYEPKDWNYERFSMFGAFYEERRGYDAEYGVVDAKWYRFGSFYNIWSRSHVEIPCNTVATTPIGESPTRDVDENGTDDECTAAPPGSRCDPIVQKCTLPYAQRATRVIPWYFGPDQDPELFDVTAQATGEWDMALRTAVQTGRLTECRRTNGASIQAIDKAACDAAFPTDEASVRAAVPPILVLCHNPVVAGDPEACGPVGRKARLGDLRYNFVNAIPTPQSGSPWGIMVDGVDPLSGAKVQASINVWDSVTKSAAQSAVDVIRWLNGELAEEDIKSGAYINQYALSGDLKEKNLYDFHTLSREQVEARVRGLDPSTAIAGSTKPSAIPAMTARELEKKGAAAFQALYGEPDDPGPKIEARYAAALGSPIEDELLTANMKELAGIDPAMPVDDVVRAHASPLRKGDLSRQLDLERLRDQRLAERGICMLEAPEPTAFVGLAKIMKEKFPIDPNETPAQTYDRVVRMRDYLRKKLYYGVVLHEMGHSIGLRHNFVGSYDAFNFRPQYWQLRTNNGTVTKACEDQVEDGSKCVGPRWHDPLDQAEIDGLIWMWQHTTVMDYPGDVTQDTLGLGPYDKAAARFFYTDTLDVWNTPGQTCLDQNDDGSCDDPIGGAIHGKVGNYGGIGGPWTFKGPLLADAVHYSQFQKEFQLIRNCRPTTKTQPPDWDEAKNGKWSPVFDGQVVLGTDCDGPPVDYIDYRDLDGYAREKRTGRVRWPHMFATDYSADIGNVAVLRHDNGADVYEQFSFLMNTYENRHIFDNFRRGRQSFTVRGAAYRSMSRFHDKMRNIIQGFALYHDWFLRSLTAETGQNYIAAFEGIDGVLKPNALAASMAFDHFVRALTRPQPGSHGIKKNAAGDKVLVSADSQLTNIPEAMILPEGSQRFPNDDFGYGARKVNNSLSNSDGIFDIQWLTSAGSYYDKIWATYHLTESSNRFLDVSLNDFVDGRYRNLSFVNIFPEGFRRMVATALTGDTGLLGPRVASSTGVVPEVDETKTPKRPLGWISWWPEDGPEACWPQLGSLVCRGYPDDGDFENGVPEYSIPVDPQVGIEVQKFIVFYSLLHLPENWKSDWVDQFRIYSVGDDSMPDLPGEGSVHFKDPVSGTLYIARRHGTEQVFGKTVERGIAARMLSWANLLVQNAYVVDSIDPVTGKVNVVTEDGVPKLQKGKKCEDNPACVAVRNYKALIDFTRQTAATFGFAAPDPIGIEFN